jgi:zinc protease
MQTNHLLLVGLLCVTIMGFFCGTISAQEPLAPGTKAAIVRAASAPYGVADVSLPTAKELIARNNEVMGGTEAWSRTATRTMKGLYQTEDSSNFFSIEILHKSPNKSLYKITYPNGVILREVCDGHSAWVEDANGGYHEFTGEALASRLRRSELLDRAKAFLLAATGKVTGMEKAGTHNTYVIEYSPEKNLVSRLYFDVDNGYVVHTEDVYAASNGPYTLKVDLDDYREVDGLKFPFRMKRTEKGVVLNIRLTQVKINVPIDDSVFLKPESSPK